MQTYAPRRDVAASAHGYAMAALLVAMSVMAILLSVALPNWLTLATREKEAELVFRGEQYARAIGLFQRQYGGAFPPNVDVLVTERFLRKKYADPITGKDFEVITPGTVIEGTTDLAALGGQPGRQGSGAATGGAARGGGRGTSTLSGGTGTAAARGGARGQPQGGRGTTTGGRGQVGARLEIRGGGGLTAGATAGVQGVRSTSGNASLRVYNGAERYDQWLFIATQASLTAGAGAVGAGAPGVGGRGDDGGRGGRGGRGADTGRGGRGGRGDATGGRGGRGGRGDATGGRGGRGGGATGGRGGGRGGGF